MPPKNLVKTCPYCSVEFTISDLVLDATVEPIGMMLQSDRADTMYVFNHTCAGCGTTFAVPVDVFESMIDEPIPQQSLAGTEACDGHCARLRDLALCDNPCSNAPYRRFLIKVLIRASRIEEPRPAIGGKA